MPVQVDKVALEVKPRQRVVPVVAALAANSSTAIHLSLLQGQHLLSQLARLELAAMRVQRAAFLIMLLQLHLPPLL